VNESIRLPARLERRAVADLRPGARNPRRHDEAQIALISRSVRRFGWTNPVLVAPDGEIVAGEARWRAAVQLGLPELPVIVIDTLSPAETEAYRLADNQLALRATWDEAMLTEVLGDLARLEVDLEVLGFAERELARLLKDVSAAAQADAAEELPPVAVTVLGDVWQLGPHRLICGDSTDPAVLDRLLGGRQARMIAGEGRADVDLIMTDPPYGMSYKGKVHGGILGDDRRGEALVALIGGALGNARDHARPGAAIYVCLTWRTYGEFVLALKGLGIELNACIVWDKGSIGPGTLHYRPQHEFIFYSAGDQWFGGAGESDVWTLSRGDVGSYVHPTQKPVALLERAIRNSSRAGETVLDVFGGSGSTLIACDRTGRLARLVELDPRYCDAIVKRWEGVAGRRALKLKAD